MGNDNPVDVRNMIPLEDMARRDIEHHDEVVELAGRAKDYLASMPWCDGVLRGWLSSSWGYIVAVFYFHIAASRPAIPQYIWTIVGDLPPAYLAAEDCENGLEAIELYVAGLQEWVDRVLEGRAIDETVIPVNVPPTEQWANALQKRLALIREHILNESAN